MNLWGFLVVFLCLFFGQIVVDFLELPLPPSIIGLVILFGLLQTKIIALHIVQPIATTLLAYLAFLVVPATIAVMPFLKVIKQDWFALTFGAGISTLLVLISVALTHRLVRKLLKTTDQKTNQKELS